MSKFDATPGRVNRQVPAIGISNPPFSIEVCELDTRESRFFRQRDSPQKNRKIPGIIFSFDSRNGSLASRFRVDPFFFCSGTFYQLVVLRVPSGFQFFLRKLCYGTLYRNFL